MSDQITETLIERVAVARHPDEPYDVMGNEQRSGESRAFESGAKWALETARNLLLVEASLLSSPKRDREDQTGFALRLVRAEHLRTAADLIEIQEG